MHSSPGPGNHEGTLVSVDLPLLDVSRHRLCDVWCFVTGSFACSGPPRWTIPFRTLIVHAPSHGQAPPTCPFIS